MRTAPYLFHLEVSGGARVFHLVQQVLLDARVLMTLYIFHFPFFHQVPHIHAGDTFSGQTETEAPEAVSDKEQHLKDAEVVHNFRRTSLGFTGPEPLKKLEVKEEEKKKEADKSRQSKKEITYADLVQNALTDLYQKDKISVPIWCHDTSIMLKTQQLLGTTTDVGGIAAAASSRDIGLDQQGDATPGSNYSMVTFTSEYPELVKQRLAVNIGLGTKVGSMNMIPVTISKRANTREDELNRANSRGSGEMNEEESNDTGRGTRGTMSQLHPKEKERNAFFASIQSRLVVEQVVQTVRGAATFSFDYLMLVLVAACLAGVGLASNNTVVIVASMLVSPIMGPILAITFGTMIDKTSLVHQGIINEIASLLICVVVGFIVAWIMIGCDAHTEWNWPTSEMAGRGTVVGIYTGIAIATPSGVGVALSILSDNTSSLVGVAISASLLPPAVNAGMMWAYAIFIEAGWKGWMLTKGGQGIAMDANATVMPAGVSLQTPEAIAWAGFISLALTLVNIAIIIVIACMMFWCKSVVKYEGESSGWQDEYEKYKAANFIVRNDKKGRALAKRAAFVAKLGAGIRDKPTKRTQVEKVCCCFSCFGCFGNKGGKNGGKGGRNNNGQGGGIQIQTIQTTEPGPGGISDMTPHPGARPVANTLFDAPGATPSNKNGEGTPDMFPDTLPVAQVHAISNAVTMGHRTLERMMSGVQLNNGDHSNAVTLDKTTLKSLSHGMHGGGSMRSPTANANTLQPGRRRQRRFSLQSRDKHIGVGKSLFAGRRQRHDHEANALQNAAREIALLQTGGGGGHHHHSRQLTHSQYLETIDALETLHATTGSSGFSPRNTSIAGLFDNNVTNR